MTERIVQLQEKIKKMELERQQLMHRLQLLENRKNYLERKPKKSNSGSVERAERSHRLITRGAAIECILPETKNLMEQEFYQLMETVFSDGNLKAEAVRQIECFLSGRGGSQWMALYHFHVGQVKRSAGYTAVAAAAYRAGERLHCDYYGETHDYTRKGGVIFSEVILPPQAPQEYADRQTLWNAVESVEKHPQAQLAYSFDIALQNEFTLDENIALARKFIQSNFVARGMLADWVVHGPDKGDGMIPNPHFHVLVPISPIREDGKWGNKQSREYKMDENGRRIRKANGEYIYNAVPATDWGSPETLKEWRKNWADLVNAKFEEKGLGFRIDHRSYKDMGLDIIPQVHEGSAVRRMEAKGIVTEKREMNRWIRKTNRAILEIIGMIRRLSNWYHDAKEEMQKLKEPAVMMLVSEFYDHRDAAADTFEHGRQKAKNKNLKKRAEIYSYLQEKQIVRPEQLGSIIEGKRDIASGIKTQMDEKADRMKKL